MIWDEKFSHSVSPPRGFHKKIPVLDSLLVKIGVGFHSPPLRGKMKKKNVTIFFVSPRGLYTFIHCMANRMLDQSSGARSLQEIMKEDAHLVLVYSLWPTIFLLIALYLYDWLNLYTIFFHVWWIKGSYIAFGQSRVKFTGSIICST